MKTYIVLIRGINVGGGNKIQMSALRQYLEELGFAKVTTYIASGNVILQSEKKADEIQQIIEDMLPQKFTLGSKRIKVLVLPHEQLAAIVRNKPKGFGDNPETYYSDAIFLMDGQTTEQAMAVFRPREGVDKVWPGKGVIYSQRLGAERTKSRLGEIIGTPAYKSMTIRSWNTTTKLLALADNLAA